MRRELLPLLDRRVPRYTSYPTAPHFTAEIGEAPYRQWLAAAPTGEPVSVYVHVPFCAALCWYCGCNTRVVRGRRPIDEYLDQLSREAELIGAALPGRVTVGHLHLGGGTPNQLDVQRLEQLRGILDSVFDIATDAEFSVELDPRRLTGAQAAALAALGVTRASLGVQDFERRVQQAINRIQPFELVARAVEELREAGIASVGFDLMYGLPHQTVETVTRTATLAAGLSPDRISLFGYAHVPWMKRHQMQLDARALPDAAGRCKQEAAAATTLVTLGFERVGLDHFAKPGDPLAARHRASTIRRNFQGYTTDTCRTLIGLGPSAIGSLAQGYVQNHADPVAYRDAVLGGRLPIARGRALGAEDRVRREIIERLMCTLGVDVDLVARSHGAALTDIDLGGVDALAALGVCERDGSRITVPEENRPLVRLACAAFDAYLGDGLRRHAPAV